MKLRLAAFLGAAVVSPALFGAEPGVEFSGVLTANGKTQLALTDKASKTTTWVAAGDVFNGYSVVRYDAKEDAVFLKRNGEEIRLGLVPAKTSTPAIAAAAPLATSPTFATATATTNAVRANLRQLATAARQLQQRGVTNVSYADLVGPGKPIPQLTPIAGENYSTLTFNPNVTAVSVTTATGATISLEVPPATTASASAVAASAPSAPGVPNAPTGLTITGTTLPAPNAAPVATPNVSPSATSTAATPNPAPSPPAESPVAATTPYANTNTAGNAVTAANPPGPTSTAETLPPTGRPTPAPAYVVQGGDTLDSIAQVNGVTVQQLRELNPALSGGSLRAGDTIRIR